MGQQGLFLEIATKSRHRQVGQKWDSGTKKWDSVPKWAKNGPVVGNETLSVVGNEAHLKTLLSRFCPGSGPLCPVSVPLCPGKK